MGAARQSADPGWESFECSVLGTRTFGLSVGHRKESARVPRGEGPGDAANFDSLLIKRGGPGASFEMKR